MGWFFFAILNFFFQSTIQYVVQSISFLFTGEGRGVLFLLTLGKNLFRNKSVCSIFSSKINQLPFR